MGTMDPLVSAHVWGENTHIDSLNEYGERHCRDALVDQFDPMLAEAPSIYFYYYLQLPHQQA